MEIIKLGYSGPEVRVIKTLLNRTGSSLSAGLEYDKNTEDAVKEFQRISQIKADGEVGPITWSRLYGILGYGATDSELESEQYFHKFEPKDSIYLHHTAGGPSPKVAIDTWNANTTRVATSFVIGGTSRFGNKKYNGELVRVFPEFYWAHHLGVKGQKSMNYPLHRRSIGIEISSYGPLIKFGGKFYFKADHRNGYNKKQKTLKATLCEVPGSQVVDLKEEWRGFRYFQKYTPEQIQTCRELILHLAYFYRIPIRDFEYSRDWFDLNQSALSGEPGLWTHVNVRRDKTDCFPQPELIDMLNGLYRDFDNFEPKEFVYHTVTKKSMFESEMIPLEDRPTDLEDITGEE